MTVSAIAAPVSGRQILQGRIDFSSAIAPRRPMSISEAEYLRQKAQKCFRLARSINDQRAVAELEKFGRELEQRATELESKADRKK